MKLTQQHKDKIIDDFEKWSGYPIYDSINRDIITYLDHCIYETDDELIQEINDWLISDYYVRGRKH